MSGLEDGKSIEELLKEAITAGATHFTLEKEESFTPEEIEEYHGKVWHWDIYEGDPWKHFRIIKPWTIRLSRTQNKYNRFLGFLPFHVYYDCWYFGIFGYAKNIGCSCGWQDVDHLAVDLASGLETFYCDKEGTGDCKDCGRNKVCETGIEELKDE